MRIRNTLNNYGIRIGTLKKKINFEMLSENLKNDIEDISWIFARLKGCRLVLTIAYKKKLPPKMIDKDVIGNIIAKKDGYIKTIITKSGTNKVKENDLVRKGDILIAGEVEYKDGTKDKVTPLGEVYGRTWYSKKVIIERIVIENVITDKVFTGYYTILGKKKIFFFNNDVYNENYDKIVSEWRNTFLNKVFLPVRFFKVDIYKKKSVERHFEYNQALANARCNARKLLKSDISGTASIVSEKELISTEGKNSYIEVIWECVEDIGEIKVNGG
jgi:similar to stage IV sporulation protein